MRKGYRLAGAGACALTLAAGLLMASAQLGVAAPPKPQVGNARAVTTHHLAETFGRFAVGAPTLDAKFTADTSLCVAVANNGVNVVQHPCSGSGIV